MFSYVSITIKTITVTEYNIKLSVSYAIRTMTVCQYDTNVMTMITTTNEMMITNDGELDDRCTIYTTKMIATTTYVTTMIKEASRCITDSLKIHIHSRIVMHWSLMQCHD